MNWVSDRVKKTKKILKEMKVIEVIQKQKYYYVQLLGRMPKYHKFLGKSLMMEKDCDTLLNLAHRDNKYIYQFKNTKVTSTASPSQLFTEYGYEKSEAKTAPIVFVVKDKIMGLVKRF